MQEGPTQNDSPYAGRLVLGFDAGCFKCSDLAAWIEELVGEKLGVRSLRDPEVEGWREQTFDENAKWAPILFEMKDGKVRAWAGWRMGWVLSRAIGPAAAWQVVQALEEVGAAPKIEESVLVEKPLGEAAKTVVGMRRGQFLKGVSGAAVDMSGLSSNGVYQKPVRYSQEQEGDQCGADGSRSTSCNE